MDFLTSCEIADKPDNSDPEDKNCAVAQFLIAQFLIFEMTDHKTNACSDLKGGTPSWIISERDPKISGYLARHLELMKACGIPVVFSKSSSAQHEMLERFAQFSQTAEALFEAVSEVENDEDLPPLDDAPQQQSEETKQETKTVSDIE